MVLRARIRSSHAAWCRPWNPSWLLATSFVCRRSTACVFIHQCSWGSFSAISLWIRSCMLNVSIAQAPPSCCCHRYFLYLVLIALLLPLLRGLSPVYSTEHIPKYRSIENFMKLSFQQVVIRFTLVLRAVQKISECTTFDVLAITFCGKLRLTSFLIRWNWNFVELLNIQKYTTIFFWGRAEYWWE